jgi:two-component system NtrC family sensor kinase
LQAEGAAEKIGQFIKEIEAQMGWTTQLTWSPALANTIEQRRFDGLRLLRQVPAITEFAQLDASGKEQLRCRAPRSLCGAAAWPLPFATSSLQD